MGSPPAHKPLPFCGVDALASLAERMASHVPQGLLMGSPPAHKPLPFCGVDALATVALDLRPLLQTTVCMCSIRLQDAPRST